jgi:hypothetical protein
VTSDDRGVCPSCDTPIEPSDYRCEGELPDGTRCEKDLVGITGDRDGHGEVIVGP